MIRHNGIKIDRKRAAITIHGRKKYFRNTSPRKYGGGGFDIWQHLLLREMSLPMLFNAMYGDDADGGPERGFNHLRVRLSQYKQQFATMGVELQKDKRGGVIYMRLVPVDVV